MMFTLMFYPNVLHRGPGYSRTENVKTERQWADEPHCPACSEHNRLEQLSLTHFTRPSVLSQLKHSPSPTSQVAPI